MRDLATDQSSPARSGWVSLAGSVEKGKRSIPALVGSPDMRIADVLLDVGVSRMFVSRWPVAVALVRPTLPHPAGAASHSWCVVQVIACRITASGVST